MAQKVQVIAKDDTGRDIPFGTKTLTAEFKDKVGKKYQISIQEPGQGVVLVGEYTTHGVPPPPPDQPMKVSAGDDVNTVEGQLVILDGSASDDNHSIIRATWTQVQGPLVQLTVDPADNTNVSFTAPAVDIASVQLVFQLEAENDAGDIKQDQVIVTVRDTSIPPPPPPIGLLYDSNINGQWNNGIHRTVKNAEGKITPNGKGLYTAASGSPELEILGDGTAILRTFGGGNYGRIYILVLNYNAVLQLSFKMISNVDNLSLKLRSRHQSGGSCENRQGGEGFAISHTDWDAKREKCHNIHSKNGSGALSKSIEDNKWYTAKFTCKDENASSIRLIGEVDYGAGFVKEMDLVDKSPEPWFFDKALNAQNSYFWIRLNSGSGNGANEVALKDVTVTAL